MAPGGRLASESPVRRPRFTGGASPAPTYSAYYNYTQTYDANGVSTPQPGASFLADLDDNWLVVGYAVGTAADWTPPSGWTVLVSGSSGRLDHCLAYKRVGGTMSYGFTSATSGNETAWENDDGLHLVKWWSWEPTALTPVATTYTAAGSSAPFVVPGVGIMAGGAIATAAEDFAYDDDPAIWVTVDWTVGWDRRLYGFLSEDHGTVTITEGGSSSLGSDYVGVRIGLV